MYKRQVIHNLINEYQKSIFVIAENSLIITPEGTRTSGFLPWDKKITVDLMVGDIIFTHEFTPVSYTHLSHTMVLIFLGIKVKVVTEQFKVS